MGIVKPRVFDKVLNKMADDVELIDFSSNTVKIAYEQKICGEKVHPYTWYRKFEEVEFLYPTGLKDIDGVEIYEGDIVQIIEYEARYDGKFDEFRSAVIFINGYFGYLQYEEHLGHKTDYYLSSVCTEDGIDHKGSHFCNVVGNKFENPELLGSDE